MKGQHNLNAIRRQGIKPGCVFVEVLDTVPIYNLGNDPEAGQDKVAPELHIMPGDKISTLDLSDLTDLKVHVLGANERRIVQVCRRAVQFGVAELVVAMPDEDGSVQAGVVYQKMPTDIFKEETRAITTGAARLAEEHAPQQEAGTDGYPNRHEQEYQDGRDHQQRPKWQQRLLDLARRLMPAGHLSQARVLNKRKPVREPLVGTK